MLRFFWRVLRASSSLHLLLPLAVSIVVAGILGYAHGDVHNTRQLLRYLLAERLPDLAAIYFVFIVVVVLVVRHESQLRIANLSVLDDVLPGARSYFGIAPTPLREWFDPAVQVYLARIVAQRLIDPAFRHQRVLLFFSNEQFRDAHASYQDEYYAKALVRQHEEFDAALGFLSPDDLFQILGKMTLDERLALRCYSRFMRRLPRWLLAKVKLKWSSRIVRSLAFALLEDANGAKRIIIFANRPTELDLCTVEDAEKAKPYLRLVQLVQDRVYRPGTQELKHEYRFGAHL
ncbi:MAG TPA: hypothetical protein VJZ00_05950 [Thermoanaerobaculia bacterium]|nr:hypothetical protein [Thermoanaerobaculia bacterium]